VAGTGGFLPITVPLASVRSGLESLFANQGSLAARIVSSQDGALFAMVSGLRIPLPKDAGLKSGDPVTLTLTREGGEARLTVKPALARTPQLPAQAPAAASPKPTPETEAAAPASRTPATPETFVVGALPKGIRAGSPVVRLLTRLFTGNDMIAEFVDALRSLAERQTAKPDRVPDAARSEEPAQAAAAIRKWVRVQRSSPEAQLAAMPSADAPLEDSEVIELAKLRHELFGKAVGVEREGRSENIFDRLTASRVWNLHGQNQPYLFAELPVTPGAFWRRAQLHVFGDGGEGKNRFDGPVSAILDLDTEALGAMWATVRTDGRGACSCVVRAAETRAGDAIAAASPELETALQRAGYPTVEVRVEPWETERMETLHALTARLSGLDTEA
jgi:hypothetical protein